MKAEGAANRREWKEAGRLYRLAAKAAKWAHDLTPEAYKQTRAGLDGDADSYLECVEVCEGAFDGLLDIN